VALDLTFHQKRADRRQLLSRRRVSRAPTPIGRPVPAGGAAPHRAPALHYRRQFDDCMD
jgi:hypothetical protein